MFGWLYFSSLSNNCNSFGDAFTRSSFIYNNDNALGISFLDIPNFLVSVLYDALLCNSVLSLTEPMYRRIFNACNSVLVLSVKLLNATILFCSLFSSELAGNLNHFLLKPFYDFLNKLQILKKEMLVCYYENLSKNHYWM